MAGTENGLYKINVVTNAIEFESTDVNTISIIFIRFIMMEIRHMGKEHINGFCKLMLK